MSVDRDDVGRVFPELAESYEVLGVISKGTFSVVYLARARWEPKARLALKRVNQTSAPDRSDNELTCLRVLNGECNVSPLISAYRSLGYVTIALPYFPHDQFRDYYSSMTMDEVRRYMTALFTSLEHVHANGFIHRDVKPSNFLYNRAEGTYQLVDFGLAQRVHKPSVAASRKRTRTQTSSETTPAAPGFSVNKKPSTGLRATLPSVARAGTRGFRAPEVVLLVSRQTTAIDIFSAGVILLSIMTNRYPFFHSTDDFSALVEMSYIFGTRRLREAAAQMDRSITMPEKVLARSWEDLCFAMHKDRERSRACPPEAYDLLNRALDPRPDHRITARQALEHPFLKPT